MYKPSNYETTEAKTGDFETLALGGHVCVIKKAYCTPAPEGKNYKELLTIEFDIAEGENKGYYQRRFDSSTSEFKKWQGKIYQTIKEQEDGYFKAFVTVLEKSNSGFKFDFDETKLAGKLFGGVFGEEEYINKDGEIKVTVKCVRTRSIEEIRKGVPVPDIKRLAGRENVNVQTQGFAPIGSDDELPF